MLRLVMKAHPNEVNTSSGIARNRGANVPVSACAFPNGSVAAYDSSEFSNCSTTISMQAGEGLA
jgi:hypothetical protein